MVRAGTHDGGSFSELTVEQFIQSMQAGKTAWAHVDATVPSEVDALLRDTFSFHPLDVEDALSPNERPGLQSRDAYLFLSVPMLCEEEGEKVYHELAFFLGSTWLVTTCTVETPLIEEWWKRFRANGHRVASCPTELTYGLIDAVVDDYFPAVDAFEAKVEQLEDLLFEGGHVSMSEAIRLKKGLLEMRRRISPVRDVVNAVLRKDSPFVDARFYPYFQDIYDHTLRLNESIDLLRDVLTSVMDAHLSVVSNNLNTVMKKMTVISTLLMTMALVAGVYGMNFRYMPELQWADGYPFALVLMAGLSGVELLVFRWLKWL